MVVPGADTCYRAVKGRDARFDGWFFVAVRTTRIYCRPSCPAMTPQRSNVSFLPSSAAAQRAGYRACKRTRRLLDLDADPVAVDVILAADPHLAPLVAKRPGLRSHRSSQRFSAGSRDTGSVTGSGNRMAARLSLDPPSI